MESLDTIPGILAAGIPAFVKTDNVSEGHLPPGDYFPNKSEFEGVFVSPSQRRAEIYEGWQRHRRALEAAGLSTASRQLLNGSFTTAKLIPGDIDLAVEIPDAEKVFEDSAKLNALVSLLRGPEMKPDYDCDAYPIFVFPESHPHYSSVTLEGIRYWTKWFAQTRSGNCKGRVWATVGGFNG
jgi:hypothetical protein